MHRFGTIAILALLACFSLTAWGYPTGMTGVTNKTGGKGCYCHSGPTLSTVSISGPTTLKVGQTGTYTLALNGGTLIGCDIAASTGTVAGVTTGLQSLNGEVTHSMMLGGTSVQFTYTPTSAGAQTLYATGAKDSKSGGWGHAPNFAVNVTSATTEVKEEKEPTSFALEQNWPNPFNPSTTIGYTVGWTGDQGSGTRNVKLAIYNMLGQEVATLVNEQQAPGAYRVRFDGKGLPSGIYLYQLQAGDKVMTKRMMLLK